MDDKMQAYMGEFMEFVKAQASDGITFARAQAPLVVQEYLRYEFQSSIVAAILYGVIVLLMVILACWVVRTAVRKARSDDCEDGETVCWAAGSLIAIVVATIVFFAIGDQAISNAFWAWKVKVEPRVVVLDKASKWLHK